MKMGWSQERLEGWAEMPQGVHKCNGSNYYHYKGGPLEEYEEYDEFENEPLHGIIVSKGVIDIPDNFMKDTSIRKVYMSDTVKRIGDSAFHNCQRLQFIQLSRNLESIDDEALAYCPLLESFYLPPSCTKIGNYVLAGCNRLENIHVPKHTDLELFAFTGTLHFQYDEAQASEVHHLFIDDRTEYQWRQEYFHFHNYIKSLDCTKMHEKCSSVNPSEHEILRVLQREGLGCLEVENDVGYTPLECLELNPHSNIRYQDLVNLYILWLLGLVAN